MECPPLGPGGEDITWPDQVAPRGRKASSTRKIKPQTSNLKPRTGPTACALASWRCVPWDRREGFPWGGALRRCEGHGRSGARPPPAARPRGGLLGSTTHVLWAPVCGRGGPSLSLWLACPAAGCVPPGWWEADPGGGRLPPSSEASGIRHCPSPGRLSLGVRSQDPLPVCPSHGWCGQHGGPSTGPTGCAPANGRGALWGWREGVPGGGVTCAVVRGVCGQALVLPRLPVLGAGCRGPLPHCCRRGRANVGAQHCPFGLNALRGAACRGGGGRPPREAGLPPL